MKEVKKRGRRPNPLNESDPHKTIRIRTSTWLALIKMVKDQKSTLDEVVASLLPQQSNYEFSDNHQ